MKRSRAMLLSVCVLSALPSVACSCFWGSLEKSYKSADVVVQATLRPGTTRYVVDTNDVTLTVRKVVLDVSKTWKGTSVSEIAINTDSSTTCGYTFKENEPIIVFATFRTHSESTETKEKNDVKDTKSRLYTSYCADNVVLSKNTDSREIQTKLDQLQERTLNSTQASKYSNVLRDRIREVLQLNTTTSSKLK